MKILSVYLAKTICSNSLLILLILMGLELLFSFINQISDIGVGNYGVLQAMFFAALDMPYQIYNFFPMAGLIGSLLGLGVLANQNELIVLRAAGFATGHIIFTVLKVAFVMIIFAMMIGEIIAPYTEQLANEMKAVAKSGGQAVPTKRGVWLRSGNAFINIQTILAKDHLQGLTSYEFSSDHRLKKVYLAREAFYQKNVWMLQDVKLTTLENDRVLASTFSQLQWDLSVDPNLLPVMNNEARNMSLSKLYSYIHYSKLNGLQTVTFELNFWKRIFQPLATLVMIFLAVPFVFGSIRSIPIGVRIVTGIAVGFVFYILNQFFAPLSILYQLPPLLAASLPTFLFTFAGFFMLWRIG